MMARSTASFVCQSRGTTAPHGRAEGPIKMEVKA
jgi:hypothetical protein